MKKLGILALLLSLSVFSIGCQKKEDAKPADTTPAADGGAAPAGDAPAKTE